MIVSGMMNDDKASSKFAMAEEQPSFKWELSTVRNIILTSHVT